VGEAAGAGTAAVTGFDAGSTAGLGTTALIAEMLMEYLCLLYRFAEVAC
jgi:hypothetical protein